MWFPHLELPQEDAEKLFAEADLNKDGMHLGMRFVLTVVPGDHISIISERSECFFV